MMSRVIRLTAALAAAAMIPLTMFGGGATADEVFTKPSTITVPGGLNSFDIGFVDPTLGLYFLADRTNKAIDVVKTSDNSITQLHGGFAGVVTVGVPPGGSLSG